VLKVVSDILYAIDNGDLSVLALIDLSAAFDTVDHEILLLQRIETSFGVGGLAREWFKILSNQQSTARSLSHSLFNSDADVVWTTNCSMVCLHDWMKYQLG